MYMSMMQQDGIYYSDYELYLSRVCNVKRINTSRSEIWHANTGSYDS